MPDHNPDATHAWHYVVIQQPWKSQESQDKHMHTHATRRDYAHLSQNSAKFVVKVDGLRHSKEKDRSHSHCKRCEWTHWNRQHSCHGCELREHSSSWASGYGQDKIHEQHLRVTLKGRLFDPTMICWAAISAEPSRFGNLNFTLVDLQHDSLSSLKDTVSARYAGMLWTRMTWARA